MNVVRSGALEVEFRIVQNDTSIGVKFDWHLGTEIESELFFNTAEEAEEDVRNRIGYL